MKSCWKCNTEWLEKHSPGFRDECEKCFAPLRCCKNCRFFIERSSVWCNEPMARDEIPSDNEKANKCSYFMFNDNKDIKEVTTPDNQRQELSKIFGDDINTEKPSEPPDWTKTEDTGEKDINDIFKPPDN
jgi:hypothetical protein